MGNDLETTNLLLGIMAAVSVLEALLIIGMAIAGWVGYRRMRAAITDLEHRHLAPTVSRVSAILDDVQEVTSTVRADARRVDSAIHHTVRRVDETTERVGRRVRSQVSGVVGMLRGVRGAIEAVLTTTTHDDRPNTSTSGRQPI